MKDPDLLEATDSEPLSFEEEVEMQQSWRDDPNKCTFIIVHSSETYQVNESSANGFSVRDNLGLMVGDVNLFLSEIDEESDNSDNTDKKPRRQAEIDIMIANKNFRKMGLGRSATCSMLLYGAKTLGIKRFFCKINEDNTGSIKLFESLGFHKSNYAACFKQVELELVKPLSELKKVLEPYGAYTTIPCPLRKPESHT